MIVWHLGELHFELMKTVAEMERTGPSLKPPPLGICPREIHRANRIGNIIGAIWRYVDADKRVPSDWVNELQQLIDEHNAGKHE